MVINPLSVIGILNCTGISYLRQRCLAYDVHKGGLKPHSFHAWQQF